MACHYCGNWTSAAVRIDDKDVSVCGTCFIKLDDAAQHRKKIRGLKLEEDRLLDRIAERKKFAHSTERLERQLREVCRSIKEREDRLSKVENVLKI